MCLDIKKSEEPKIATKNITCYKILRIVDNILMTFYYHKPVKIGSEYNSKLTVNYDDMTVSQRLHSYSQIIYAENTAIYRYLNNTVLVKCIIPKGSTYYIGKFNLDISYASDKLRYIEIL